MRLMANLPTVPEPLHEPALVCREGAMLEQFHYWRGASGRRYLHTVFALIDCPEMPKANYILVRREADGSRRPIAFGQTVDDAGSLNLAHLRRRGARLGANEVHVHLLAENAAERTRVECDLRAGQRRPVPAPASAAA